jgi:hypothetical protein
MVRWWTRLRHLGEEWLTGVGSQRWRRLDGGAHRCWVGGAVGGTGGRASGHWGIVEELADRAMAPECTARLGSGRRLQVALLTLQLPPTMLSA